ncbi:MAG TPA: hypothetical protein VGE07_08840 [Herpetosiphonaceae bacterium]
MGLIKSLASGLIGSAALTAVHETARRTLPHAPRMDVIGMRALARALKGAGQRPPDRDTLFNLTLAGDVVSNGAYYSLVNLGRPEGRWWRGGALGLLAGLGSALLPEPLGLGEQTGQRRPWTQILTVAWYLIGGLAAAAAARRLGD